MKPSSSVEKARTACGMRLGLMRKRERLVPALDGYDEVIRRLHASGDPDPYVTGFSYLTSVFLESYEAVRAQIARSGKVGISEINSIKRSAGTNFQGVCEYATLKWLQTTDLPVVAAPNAPLALRDELTIYGVDTGGEFSVEPDIDICLWELGGGPVSPIIFVSAKSSLVDRAGQAARWKLYLDLHQTSCQHTTSTPDCPIHRTRVKLRTARQIEHCIVTANIYKMNTTQPEGELNSGQCRNNTYMFRNKYTTRNDPREFRPAGWTSFSEFPALVRRVFKRRPNLVP